MEHEMLAAYARWELAVRAVSGPVAAFRHMTAMAGELDGLAEKVAGQRSWLAANMYDAGRAGSLADLAGELGLSKARADQLVRRGRMRGNPVSDPGTDPLPPAVAVAVVTHDGQVLAGHRLDEDPPWTFPDGEVGFGESPAAAAVRHTVTETGLLIDVLGVIGARLHPRNGRHIIYVRATLRHGSPGEPGTDLSSGIDMTRWLHFEQARSLMPDMYPPVRELLDQLDDGL
jgi:8-oxo-dGTP diphosphatase